MNAGIFILMLLLGALAMVGFFLKYPKRGLLGILLIKPVLDWFAVDSIRVGGSFLGPQYLAPIILPILAIVVAATSSRSMRSLPLKGWISGFLLFYLFAFLTHGEPNLNSISYLLRVILPLLLYLAVPLILDSEQDIRTFFKVAVFATLFPCLMVLLQKAGFIGANREAESFGQITYARATGGYADAFSVAMLSMLGLFSLMAWMEWRKQARQTQWWMVLLMGWFLLTIMFTVHRMSYIITAVVFLLWLIVNRRFGLLMLVAAVGVSLLPIIMVNLPNIFSDLALFNDSAPSDIVGLNDEFNALSSMALDGRGGLWNRMIELYLNGNSFEQLFGLMMAGRAPHNDYIRMLLSVGLVGLCYYVLMLVLIFARLLRYYLHFSRFNDPFMKQLTLTALFVWFFYVAGGISMTVSFLSTLTWYFWILNGFVFYQATLRMRAYQPDKKQTEKPSLTPYGSHTLSFNSTHTSKP